MTQTLYAHMNKKKIKKIILVHESVFPAFRKVLVPSAWVISAYSSMNE
jgi:hypothetical protein